MVRVKCPSDELESQKARVRQSYEAVLEPGNELTDDSRIVSKLNALHVLVLLKDLHTSALDITSGQGFLGLFVPPQPGSCSKSAHRRSYVSVLAVGSNVPINPGLLIWECLYSTDFCTTSSVHLPM